MSVFPRAPYPHIALSKRSEFKIFYIININDCKTRKARNDEIENKNLVVKETDNFEFQSIKKCIFCVENKMPFLRRTGAHSQFFFIDVLPLLCLMLHSVFIYSLLIGCLGLMLRYKVCPSTRHHYSIIVRHEILQKTHESKNTFISESLKPFPRL